MTSRVLFFDKSFSNPRFALAFCVMLAACMLGYAAPRDGGVDASLSIVPFTVYSGSRINQFAVLDDGRIMVAGAFSHISGGASVGVARLNSDGTFDNTFRGRANGEVDGVFPLSDGRFLISGNFTQYDGVARNRIARTNSDGTIDTTFNPDLGTGFVKIIAVQTDGRIVVNGSFESIGGVPRSRVARLFPDGSLDPSFVPGSGPNDNVIYRAVIQTDGKIVIAGKFSHYDGVTRHGIVRLHSNGSLDTAFVPPVIPGGGGAEFFDVSIGADGKMVLAGTLPGSHTVIRLNPDGSSDNTFNDGTTSTNGRPHSVVVQPDGKVVVGGQLDAVRIKGQLTIRYRIARFNVDGSLDTSFTANGPSDGGDVRALAIDKSNRLLVGGEFHSMSGSKRGGISRLLVADGSYDQSFQGFLGGATFVNAIHVYPDGKVLVAGNFDLIDTTFTGPVARLNPNGSIDSAFKLDSSVDTQVRALAIQPDGRIIVSAVGSGPFGVPTLRRLHPNGSIDPSFGAQLNSGGSVNTVIVQPNGKILIAGSFEAVNGIGRQDLARLNPDGSIDNEFANFLGSVFLDAMALQTDGKVLIGGLITAFNGQSFGNLVRLNADGTVDQSFNHGTGANNTVHAIQVLPDGRIYVGGAFSGFNGSEYRGLVRLMPNGALDPSYKRVRLSGTVFSLLPLPGGKLIAGGTIRSALGASPREGILRFLEDGSVDHSFDVTKVVRNNSSSGEVFDLGMAPDGTILAAGQFESVSGFTRWGLAGLKMGSRLLPPVFDFDGDGRTDISVFRPLTATWYRIDSYFGSVAGTKWGAAEDLPASSDFDGDYLTDVAVFRPSNGVWYIINSSDGSYKVQGFGLEGDIPVPADFDGDKRSDLAVFRPSDGMWWIWQSALGVAGIQYGQNGDIPAVGDYDGDGRADLAVFRPATGIWYLRRSTAGELGIQFGGGGDRVTPGDYDADGSTDLAVFRPSNGVWYVINSSDGTYTGRQFGIATDLPTPGDYDGDGRSDLGIFRSDGNWWSSRTRDGVIVTNFGFGTDRPIPNSFVR